MSGEGAVALERKSALTGPSGAAFSFPPSLPQRAVNRVLFEWSVPFAITLGSMSGLLKGLTGVRYFPLVADAWLVGVLVLALLVDTSRRRLNVGKLDVLVAAFMALGLAGMFNRNVPSLEVGLEGYRKFAFMSIGALVGRHVVRTTRAIRRIFAALIVLSTLVALYGIKQFLAPSDLDYQVMDSSTSSMTTFTMGGHLRAFSTLAGPFHLGMYLTTSILLLIVMASGRLRTRLWAVAAMGVQTVALLMTVTKGNWAGLLAGVFVMVLLRARHPRRVVWKLLGWSCGLAIAFAGVKVLTSRTDELRTIDAGLDALLNVRDAPTVQFRLDLWRNQVIPLVFEAPWFGSGTGSAGEGMAPQFAGSRAFVYAHNLYLKVLVESGAMGLVLFLLVVGRATFQAFSSRSVMQGPEKALGEWAVALVCATAVSGISAPILDAYPSNLVFWLALGAATRGVLADSASTGAGAA